MSIALLTSLAQSSRRAALIGALSASTLLFACSKSDIVTQPSNSSSGSANTTASAPAQPTFTAESFSPKGLTLTEGKDYTKLPNPQPPKDGKKEVQEFFWYGCSHCYKLEPAVQAWKKTLPSDVRFVRYHAQWNAAMQSHQRIAMTLQALGKSDALDDKVFAAIQDQGRALTAEDKISEFMVENGVDKAAWDKAFKSFEVNANIVTADALFKNYQLEGVPALIVNGKYVVKGDTAEALKVVNKLLEEGK